MIDDFSTSLEAAAALAAEDAYPDREEPSEADEMAERYREHVPMNTRRTGLSDIPVSDDDFRSASAAGPDDDLPF